jgi:DNA-binding transcriptional LysR family regulator
MNELDVHNLLRALAVSETGSFAAAARRVGVSRQALHRSVESLEAMVGAPIFDRSLRQLRPTAIGREVLQHASDLRAVERSLKATIAQMKAEPAGLIRLSTPPLFGDFVVASAISRFLQKWPAVRVHVRSEVRRTDLIGDDYDLMIRIGAAPPENHFARLLGHAALVLCASPGFLDARGTIDTPEQLRGMPTLEYAPQRSNIWGFTRNGIDQTLEVDVQLVADSAAIVVDAALRGLGVLRVPELAVRDHLAIGRLRRVLRDCDLPLAEVWAVYGHRTAADPTLAAFLEELQSEFRGSSGSQR